MENNKQKIKQIIDSSGLEYEKKLLWKLFLKVSKPEEDEAIFEALLEDLENLSILSDHLADKIIDMSTENKKAWELLSKDEKKFDEFMTQLC